MSKTQIEMCKILREMNNTIKELNKTVKTLYVEIKHINEKIDDKYYLEKKEKEEKKRKEEIIQQSKIKEVKKTIHVELILFINRYNKEKEFKKKNIDKINNFNNQYFKIPREEEINKIIKHTYEPSLSDLDNWILAEKKYDYPFSSYSLSILQYLNSLMIPIKCNKHNGYGIIIENKIFIYQINKYYSVSYGDEYDSEYDENYYMDYKILDLGLFRKFKFTSISLYSLFNSNPYYFKIIDCETKSDFLKKNFKSIHSLKILEHMLTNLGINVSNLKTKYYNAVAWHKLSSIYFNRGFNRSSDKYYQEREESKYHTNSILQNIKIMEELLLKDGYDIKNFKNTFDYSEIFLFELLLKFDKEQKYIVHNNSGNESDSDSDSYSD